jgi:nicotinamide-nucleotide amidase
MSLLSAARRVARLLAETNHKIVFAESCTGGLVSQSLSRIPGISTWHCGGMVTYRNETKTAYLGISPTVLKKLGPVSEQVAGLMAETILDRTPEATIAASITGHLGPIAPEKLDGVIFIATAMRRPGNSVAVRRFELPAGLGRESRQKEAAERVLELIAERLRHETT